MQRLKRIIMRVLPRPAYDRLLSSYHLALAYLASIVYHAPSRKILVVGVTGTKGKTSTTEMISAIFESAHYSTAVLNSIRVKVGDESRGNPVGRSMPGRFFIQRFLSSAVRGDCDIAIIEMTSEGARQHRHRAIDLDALVFTNLAPEHIESHGSYQAYSDAKFLLGQSLAHSPKRPRIMVANADDPESARYLALPVEKAVPFSISSHEARPGESAGHFTFEALDMRVHFPGLFSLQNALAAAELARAFGIAPEDIQKGLDSLTIIPGRAEEIREGQDFTVVVDYAHTPESLAAILSAYGGRRRIVILGSAGGGRDTWKRPVMGKVAEENAEHVILTSDDPYDEDPRKIIDEIAGGMKSKPEIMIDRREAIRRALALAKTGDAVLITGKGIDAIYGKGGEKIPWSDAGAAREELRALRHV